MSIVLGKYRIAKECGGKLFPGIGRGYWDGWHYYLRHSKKIDLKFRTLTNRATGAKDGFAIGPLMIWKEK